MLGANAKDYDALYRNFRWAVPARYNIGVDVCDRWAARDPQRLAIQHVRDDGRCDNISFGALREASNRLANVLRAQGVKRGEPVAILFGPDALQYRLQNSGARALLTNAQGFGKFEEIKAQVSDVTCVISV